MDPKLINLFGLLLCMAGAVILALGLIVPGGRALEVSLPRMAGESDEQNVCLPAVRDRLRESRFALIGVVILTLGFLLQIIGHWPGFDSRSSERLMPLARLPCNGVALVGPDVKKWGDINLQP